LEKELAAYYRFELELILTFHLLLVQYTNTLRDQKQKYLMTFL
jgi:hypothetical protein